MEELARTVGHMVQGVPIIQAGKRGTKRPAKTIKTMMIMGAAGNVMALPTLAVMETVTWEMDQSDPSPGVEPLVQKQLMAPAPVKTIEFHVLLVEMGQPARWCQMLNVLKQVIYAQ